MNDDVSSVIGGTTIERLHDGSRVEIPYEDIGVLKSFASDPDIIEYNIARKLALYEFLETGFNKDMRWEGYKFRPVPVVIYGFDNKPKFYDFIIVDAEKKIAGTVSVYARRESNSIIRSVSTGVKDYETILSKANGSHSSLFEDWMGRAYVGMRGKAGNTPGMVINAATGKSAVGIKELDGKEIINELLKDELFLEVTSAISPAVIRAELNETLEDHNTLAMLFWAHIDQLIPELEEIDDEDGLIDANGKFIRKIRNAIRSVASAISNAVSNVISTVVNTIINVAVSIGNIIFQICERFYERHLNTDNSSFYIEKYTSYTETFRDKKLLPPDTRNWCGVWIVSYLVWIKNDRTGDTYDEALKYANGNSAGQWIGPINMNKALKDLSDNTISINLLPVWRDIRIYERIKLEKKPAVVFCLAGDTWFEYFEDADKDKKAGHWKLAIGTRADGISAFRFVKFLFHENVTIGNNFTDSGNIKRNDNKQYESVAWWNPWFFVYD